LPKDWIKDQGLKQGDQVTVGINGSARLEKSSLQENHLTLYHYQKIGLKTKV
jgi:hypothetical protein